MRVLVVDDNEDTCTLLCMGLERFGMNARSAGCLRDALAALQEHPVDAILTDWNLGDGTGHDLLGGAPRVVILTGDEDALATNWPEHVSVLKKPAPLAAVVASLQRAR